MTDYTVLWTANLDADSPVDAALQAKELVNNIDFGPDSANVFHIVADTHDLTTTLPGVTAVDLGKAQITEDGEVANRDELTEQVATTSPSVAPKAETRRVLVTETITYEIDVDVAHLADAGVDPEDTESDELDSFIADITSSLHTGENSFSIEDCQRDITWLT